MIDKLMVEHGKLYVGVSGPVEVECGYFLVLETAKCTGGMLTRLDGSVADYNWCPKGKCPVCHGTGRVTRRVSAMVECYASADCDDSDDVFYSCDNYNRYANTPEQLADTILADYRLYLSGVPIGRGLEEATLPDAVRAQLEVRDV